MTRHLPGVSCICLTYGRPALLEEAIECFLRQDYAGERELIVLNDFARQELVYAAPGVHVINLPRRFRTLGEKQNAGVALATHDLICIWDDDDIYLPHRLSLSVARFDPRQRFFKPRYAWFWDDGVLSGPAEYTFHAGSCWSRELFDEVRGYAAVGSNSDQEIEARFAALQPGSTATYLIPPEEIYYVYRWNATGSYHISGLGQAHPGQPAEHRAVADYVDEEVRLGRLPVGRITLHPHWNSDYLALVRDYIARLDADARRAAAPPAPAAGDR